MTLLETISLSHRYPDGTPSLKNVSLRIEPGETVALIGGNGAGKTTLLHHLCGILLPMEGQLLLDGASIEKRTLPILRRSVGIVFQNSDDQLFMPTILEDAAFGPLNMGLSPEEAEQSALNALEQVGCLALRDKPPHHLSGGEKRLASIATVLSMDARALLLDEPSSNLDPRSRRDLIRLLGELGKTLIIATHDLDMALDLCRRTIILHKGEIAADGPTITLLRQKDLLESCHLELPYRYQ